MRLLYLMLKSQADWTGFDMFGINFLLIQVDWIAIDFSRDLPFRLKLPMIKAAINWGLLELVCICPVPSYLYILASSKHESTSPQISDLRIIFLQRGVYFEMAYSHLISKTKPKRESMPNAKVRNLEQIKMKFLPDHNSSH